MEIENTWAVAVWIGAGLGAVLGLLALAALSYFG